MRVFLHVLFPSASRDIEESEIPRRSLGANEVTRRRNIRRTMAEEQRCQEGYRLCTNNCGFSGSPATMDLCSKCFCDRRLKEEQAVEKTLLPCSASVAKAEPDSPLSSLPESSAVETADPSTRPKIAEERHAAPPGRCTECRKRVGLMGFRCRCGLTFCGTHRYPEQHSCSFDFKGAGREAIARDNPAIKAAKLDKI